MTAYTYDRVGNAVTVTDPRGNTTRFTYDALNRKTLVTYPFGNTERYEYDAAGNMTKLTDGRGKATTYQYNSQNKLTLVTDAMGYATSYGYDRFGNMTRMQRPEGQVTTYAYDELNRLIKVTDPLNLETVYGYDLNGNRNYAMDPNGNECFYTYDADNLLRRLLVLNGLDGKCLDYQYDAAHQQILAIQSLAHLAYQGAEPTLTEESRLARGYTVMGQVESETRQAAGRDARTVTYDYDHLGNLTSMLYPGALAPLTYNYNNLGQLLDITGFIEGTGEDHGISYINGLPSVVRYANGVTLTYQYDQNGRLDTRTDAKGATQLFSLDLGYDANSNITSRTVNGHENTYAYDDLNQLLHAQVFASQAEQTRPTDYGLGYVQEDYKGAKTVQIQPDDFTVDLDYAATSLCIAFGQIVQDIQRIELYPETADHRLTNKRYLDVYYKDGGQFQKLSRDYWEFAADASTGRLTISFPDPLDASEVKIHCLFDERDGDYAALNQAQFSNLARSMVRVYRVYDYRYEDYLYDRNGNRTWETITTLYPRVRNYTYYPNSDRLLSKIAPDGEMKWAFVYDNNGNLIKKGNTFTVNGDTVTFTTSGEGVVYWEYDYDVLNRMTAVRKNGVQTAAYVYDPSGLRILKDAAEDVLYDYDLAGNVISEVNAATGAVRSYVWVTGRHLARVDGVIGGTGEKYFYECDHLGSPQVVTDKDGEPVWRGDFTPFGEKIKANGQINTFTDTHGFTGKDWDEEAGLYCFSARWYDPELGRFVEEDPMGDPNNPNLYAYCRNNPLIFIDLYGLWTYEVDLETGDLVAIVEPGDTLSEMEFYYNTIATDNNWDNPNLIHEGDRFVVKQLDEEGIKRRSEIFEDQMKEFDPSKKTDHEIRTQLHDYANVYSIWARKQDTTANEALASIMDYGAYLRNYQGINVFVTDIALVIAGVERMEVQGLNRATIIENTQYLVPWFGGTGFKPENALNPTDNQARHFAAYLLAAKEVGIRAPIGSYRRKRGDLDSVQDINLAWAAYHFWNTFSYRDNPLIAPYLMAYGINPLQGVGDWVRENL